MDPPRGLRNGLYECSMTERRAWNSDCMMLGRARMKRIGKHAWNSYGYFHKSRVPFLGVLIMKDHNILASILGPPVFWKLPC